MIDMVFDQAFVTTTAAYTPLPGGSGAVEGSFLAEKLNMQIPFECMKLLFCLKFNGGILNFVNSACIK